MIVHYTRKTNSWHCIANIMAYIFNEGCDEVAFSLTISKHLIKGTDITNYKKPLHQQSRTYRLQFIQYNAGVYMAIPWTGLGGPVDRKAWSVRPVDILLQPLINRSNHSSAGGAHATGWERVDFGTLVRR